MTSEEQKVWQSRLEAFASLTSAEREQALRSAASLAAADDTAADTLLAQLDALDDDALQRALPLVTAVIEGLTQRARLQRRQTGTPSLSPPSRERIARLYGRLQPSPRAAWGLIGWLAAARGPDDLALLAELLAASPPGEAPQLAAALGPLFRPEEYDPQPLFPRLLDALVHKHLAGPVLDLANYLTREGRLSTHPAAGRTKELISLLGALVQRLGTIEEKPDADSRTAQQVGSIVAESLPLAVSLCDALALAGDRDAVGKLYQAMELRHRRLRTEAAAALARLGEKAGADILVELAAEPVARLRVLAYAEELGFLDRIDAKYQTAAARAESQLALWLAQPSQFGIPPTSLELIDQREMFWPSYNDPVECFLFRFQYALGGGVYANIGIAGPLEHAFAADLADLPPDDIYAAFAGWQAEHEDLREQDVATLGDQQRVEVSRLERRLRDAGYDAITPRTLALFFGERVLIAEAERQGHPGIAIATSGGETTFFPRGASSRPLGVVEAYSIFKGRRLLRTFNR